jgi:hypothetical protein
MPDTMLVPKRSFYRFGAPPESLTVTIADFEAVYRPLLAYLATSFSESVVISGTMTFVRLALARASFSKKQVDEFKSSLIRSKAARKSRGDSQARTKVMRTIREQRGLVQCRAPRISPHVSPGPLPESARKFT